VQPRPPAPKSNEATLIISSNPFARTAAIAALLAVTGLCGCEAREMGTNFADKQANAVDNTWVSAVKTCWPDVAHQGYSLAGMKRYLADPLHFRAAFSTYSALTDAQLLIIVTKPIQDAPPPDTSVLDHARTPVFTRDQAIAGTSPQAAATPNSNSAVPPDALCALQTGTPVGFR
jgi:hypothetical protein